MSRLHYSLKGYIRSMQISRNPIFGFVEGKEIDSFFYGALCQKSCASYQIKRAREIPGNTGGKNALLSLYQYLHKKKQLATTFKGKKTLILFFLDKDVDDVLQKKSKSSHVIYTAFYDVQNHLFIHGDLVKAVAATVSIDEKELRSLPLLQANWCLSAAKRWRTWIVYCLFCKLHSVSGPNYRATSQINRPLNGNVDDRCYQSLIEEARLSLGWTEDRMNKELKKIERRVEKLFNKGYQDTVFKGKWYPTLLELDLRDSFRGGELTLHGFAHRITSALATTLDFSDPWASHFTEALDKFEAEIKNK